jgi:flavin-dependent dehydrogenase
MYDAIVVGARCAGSPTAMLLARKGYRVLLVDKASFPSDTMSTHIIWQPGVAQLRRWGLLAKVVGSNCPACRNIFDVGDFALVGSPPAADGVAEAYCPRRTVLDKILVDAAVEAGAEFRESFSVQEIISEGGCVIGIRARSKNGSTVTEIGRIVIGADGLHSLVARTIQAPTYKEKPPLACYYYSYWSGVPVREIEYYARDGRVVVALPTNDRLALIGVGWTAKEFSEFRADIEGNHLKTLRKLTPDLAERVQKGKRQERFVGTADVPNFFRKPYGSGWALVGDAGYHKDPITAQGISDAFEHAELLADAIDAGFSGRQPLQEALAEYERRRNEDVIHRYELACDFARLAPFPPEMRRLLEALRRNQDDTDRFFGIFAGTVPVPEFFAPENIERIVRAGA